MDYQRLVDVMKPELSEIPEEFDDEYMPLPADYIDWALKNFPGINSEADLARELGVSRATVSGWKNLKSLPTPAHQIELAALADMPEENALIHLGMWEACIKAQKPVFAAYQKILYTVMKSTAAIMIASLLGANSIQAAGTSTEQSNIARTTSIYYGK